MYSAKKKKKTERVTRDVRPRNINWEQKGRTFEPHRKKGGSDQASGQQVEKSLTPSIVKKKRW